MEGAIETNTSQNISATSSAVAISKSRINHLQQLLPNNAVFTHNPGRSHGAVTAGAYRRIYTTRVWWTIVLTKPHRAGQPTRDST